jgi:hypothetical protein
VIARAGAAVLVAALLAGCGGDEPSNEPEPVAAALRDCNLPGRTGADADLVPPALRPPPADVVSAERHSSGYEARVVYAHRLRDVMTAVMSAAKAAGYQVTDSEYEGTDGEVFLARDGARTEVRLFAVRSCPRVTQGVIEEVQS